MSGKYVVGGLAAAGAAYYLYENKKLQEINQPTSWTGTKYNQLKGDTVGAKVDHSLSTLQKTLDQKSEESKLWAKDKSKETEQYWKDKGKPFLKEKAEETKTYFEKKIDEANARVGGGGVELARASRVAYGNAEYLLSDDPNKSAILKLGDKYIDTVNSALFLVHDGVYSLKEAVFGRRTQADELADKAEKAKKEASSWFGGAVDKTKEKINESKPKRGWLDFGSTDKEKAEAALDDVARGYGENTSFWAKEKAELDKSLVQSAKEATSGAISSTKASLGSAKEVIDSKSAQALDQVAESTERAKPWFGLKTVDERDEERLDKLIAEVSKGFGENASFFAKESYDDIANKPVLIQELRNKASKNLEELKLNLDLHRTHWYSWASAKDKELEKSAKEQWESAKSFYDDVQKRLAESNEKLKDVTDSAISSTKKGLDYANEKTQDGLTAAQNWVKK